MYIAVDQSRLSLVWTILSEPFAELLDSGQLRMGVTRKLRVALKLMQPTGNLARKESLWPAEILESNRLWVHCVHLCQSVDHGASTPVSKPPIGAIRLGQFNSGIEPDDILHHVRGRANCIDCFVDSRNNPRMRNPSVAKST